MPANVHADAALGVGGEREHGGRRGDDVVHVHHVDDLAAVEHRAGLHVRRQAVTDAASALRLAKDARDRQHRGPPLLHVRLRERARRVAQRRVLVDMLPGDTNLVDCGR
eukprot:321375-Pleurochrysis_carterae.AAC.1